MSIPHILWGFNLGERCQYGDRFVAFADLSRLFVTSKDFQLVYHSNDDGKAHQVDYILVRSDWASLIEENRDYRGGVTGSANGTDHTRMCLPGVSFFNTTKVACITKSVCPS